MTSERANWMDSLRWQIQFYNGMPAHHRHDPEFDWAWFDNRDGKGAVAAAKSVVKRVLRRLPVKTRWRTTDDSYSLPWIERHADALWDARGAFSDQMSALVFDLHLVLRAASHQRFYFPRTEFRDLVEVLDDQPFAQPGLPSEYLGVPLRVFRLRLTEGAVGEVVEVVTTRVQLRLLNSYRQYLLQRGGVDMWPRSGDVVLDCGACIGEVSLLFAALVGTKGAVHMFDPVPLHEKYCRLQGELNPALRQVLHTNVVAVGSEVRRMRGTRADVASIAPGGLQVDDFDMTTIDAYVEEKRLDRVDFVKMDVEGAELASLRGGENTIRRFQPTLAISAYHKPQDLWELPQKIKALLPEYELYFGHHTPIQWESVFYAISPRRGVGARGGA